MSAEPPVTYLSQGIDYLGFLNAKLRDLKGWATLANELIQNADDAESATRVFFDVTDDSLVVENNALFTDCGAVPENHCRFDPVGDGKKCCDFHAFRRVASGHKRQESDTTGAFGIGFTSVYQITDRPTLRSGQWQWVLRPEESESQRIEAIRLQNAFQATRFEFPWAITQTPLRNALGIEPVAPNVVDQMCTELRKALTVAAPFLKRLETLELRRKGKPELVVNCARDPSAGEILVQAGGDTRLWKRVTGEFIQDAATLRTRYGTSIEAKRKSEVTVAVSFDALSSKGLLYAALPTEHDIALPVLINADFYPSSDRKRILFDQDYQGEWNRAAIRATARALAVATPDLRELIEPVGLWRLFQSAKELQRSAANNEVDTVFAAFWERLAPVVRSGQFVRTTSNGWCAPEEARLLQSIREEASVLPLLEEVLGLKVVHLDLQPFATLLRDKEVGVGYLNLDDLTGGLLKSGYDRVLTMEQAAYWLRSAEHRAELGQEVARLLEKVAKDAKVAARDRACRCAVVLSTEGALTPANQLRSADSVTRNVFAQVAPDHYWASDTNPPELLELVSAFTVRDAATLLLHAGQDKLTLCSQANGSWISKVIGWFVDNRTSIAGNGDLAKTIRTLPIWPSGEELRSLEELSVPGGFEDRLKLARILDLHISSRWSSFLLDDLGARRLDLGTYLTQHVPRAFEPETWPDFETRRALLHVLVDHAGDLLDNREAATALRRLPIVECQDGEFHRPVGTYFESALIQEVFGGAVPLAKPPLERQKATRDVLAWLGVGILPGARDVLERVASLTEGGPSTERREGIHRLFKGLAENWEALANEHNDLEELRHMKWLPGDRSMEWLPPSGVYSVFSRFLFETQAEFLDVPMLIQRVAADGLLRFLQIRSEPDVVLVVKHLLQLAQQGAEVNMQVYEFLNRNADDQKINLLKGRACLYLSDRRYVEGATCYWGAHPFGHYRVHLGSDWRKYQTLLTILGVSEQPTSTHALRVLREVSQAYADNRRLEGEGHQVVMNCWSQLSDYPDSEPDLADSLSELRVVPNTNHYLKKPCEVFFDNRPGLADKFDEVFRKMVIRRPETAWRAMAAAGVQYLSSAVRVELVECANPAPDEEMAQRLLERWPLVRRVFAAMPDIPVGLSKPPELWGCDRLKVSYRILDYPGPTEEVMVHLTESNMRMYFLRDQKNVWGTIARELAFGFYPDISAGLLAAAIKEVLQSKDVAEARAGLDDLGFSEIVFDPTESVTDMDVGFGMGAGGIGETDQDGGRETGEEYPDDAMEESVTGEGDETGQPEPAEPSGEDVYDDAKDLYGDDMPDIPAGTPDPDGGDGAPGGAGRGGQGGTGTGAPRDGSPGNGGAQGGSGGHTNRGGKGGGTDGSGQGKRSPGHAGGRPFISYVGAHTDDEEVDPDGLDQVMRMQIEEKAIALIIELEPTLHRTPEGNPGFDLYETGSDGKEVRWVEVKSMTGSLEDRPVGISRTQFECARELGPAYWLYVVEHATDPAGARVLRIQDPVAHARTFTFDRGWSQIARTDPPG